MLKKYLHNSRLRWYVLMLGFVVVFVMFIPINRMISKLRLEEQKKVQVWAKAISNKAEVIKKTTDFYDKITKTEQARLQQFIKAYQVIISQPITADLSSPELNFYTQIIMDNTSIPVIITDEFNNIQLSQNIEIPEEETVLRGDLYRQFSKNKPYEYEVYGMKFKLYYTESNFYNNAKYIFDNFVNSFFEEVTKNTGLIPVVVTDSTKRHILASGNIAEDKLQPQYLSETLESMASTNDPIKLVFSEDNYGYIFYKQSRTITLLQYYPLLYLAIVMLFGVLFFKLFQMMKQSQQDSVWVGMSRETAHQLGTPISSLIAWNEILAADTANETVCKEINKDIKRLDMIAQRFSQIGSNPDLKKQDITLTIYNLMSYISVRLPKRIKFNIDVSLTEPVILPINSLLMEWTLENIIKNAVDAMEGNGFVTVGLKNLPNKVLIDISDTGKGMPKKMFRQVFSPGFTTKKRGWGLGLSLAKRIVEEYHKGKIYVKSSEIGKGTTFRIELSKNSES